MKSLRDGIILVLSTGYSMGCAAAIILNAIIPAEADEHETPAAIDSNMPPVKEVENSASVEEMKA